MEHPARLLPEGRDAALPRRDRGLLRGLGAQRRRARARGRRDEALHGQAEDPGRPLPDARRHVRPRGPVRDPVRPGPARVGVRPGLRARPDEPAGAADSRRLVPDRPPDPVGDHRRRAGRRHHVLRALAAARRAALSRAAEAGPGRAQAPARLHRARRELAGRGARRAARLARLLHGGLRDPRHAGQRGARDGRPGRRANHPDRPRVLGAAAGDALLRPARGHGPDRRHREHHRLHVRRLRACSS